MFSLVNILRIFLYHLRHQNKFYVIPDPLCDRKELCHTALLQVQLVHLLEHVVVFVVMHERLAATRCTARNALHYAMPIATARVAVNLTLKTTKMNLIAMDLKT